MEIYVTVKEVGKRTGYMTRQTLVLRCAPGTLRQLIEQVVLSSVEAYNNRVADSTLLKYLTPTDIDEQVETGKVGFGERHNFGRASGERAVATAIQAYTDALYRVFAEDVELTELDAPITLREGTVVTFIRFTMLAGRMW